MLRATWRGLSTVERPAGAPVLDPTCGSRGRAIASGDPVGEEKSSSLYRDHCCSALFKTAEIHNEVVIVQRRTCSAFTLLNLSNRVRLLVV